MDKLQTFRNYEGNIICIKIGWIAVDIPAENRVVKAEIRGTSTRYVNDKPVSYYDIALNGRCVLHIFRYEYEDKSMPEPYFVEKYPL